MGGITSPSAVVISLLLTHMAVLAGMHNPCITSSVIVDCPLHHQLLLIAHYIISYSGLPIASSVIVDYHISAHYIINYLENLNMGCFHLKNPAYYTVCYFH